MNNIKEPVNRVIDPTITDRHKLRTTDLVRVSIEAVHITTYD